MRYLRRNKACQMPSRMVFFDTETRQEPLEGDENGCQNVFRLGVARYVRLDKEGQSRRETFRFDNRTEFWDWIDRKAKQKTQLYIFAHNLPFDLTVGGFWMELQAGRYRLSDNSSKASVQDCGDTKRKMWRGFLVREDPPTVVKVRRGPAATLTFVDTLNYWQMSLAELGERVGVPKMTMPDWEASDDEWFTYCERDVVVLERTMIAYIDWLVENDLGNFRFTRASQAFAAFNHRFRKQKILLHERPEVQQLEREGYYGGRLESFYVGDVCEESFGTARCDNGDVWERKSVRRDFVFSVDVNSLYPAVMRQFCYPTGLEEYREVADSRRWESTGLCHRCIADVAVRSDGDLPKRINGVGVVYPRGTFRTTLTGPELELALERGNVLRCYRYARYTLKPIFREFVEFFWAMRLNAKQHNDKMQDQFAKLAMNSLYGKFGQLTAEWVECGESAPLKEWAVEHDTVWGVPGMQTIQNIAGVRYRKVKRDDHPNSFCAIAAFVTAYARDRMRQLMETAGRDNVLYVVTDGLFVTRPGYHNLCDSGEVDAGQLGKLKLEASDTSGWFGGTHWYRVGTKDKRGSNKKQAIALQSGLALQQRWERLQGILKRCPTDTVRIYPQNKMYSRNYTRGTILHNGNVEPLYLDEPLDD